MLKYQELLKEEGKNESDLPNEIKAKIRALKMAGARAAKNPTNPNLQASAERSDILIADAIQSWIEKDLPAPGSTPPPAPAPVKQQPAKVVESEEEKQAKLEAKNKSDAEKLAAKEKAEKEALEEKEKNNLMEARNKIVTIMNANSQRAIGKADLTNILGREPKDKEKVGELSLYRVYLTQRWKVG